MIQKKERATTALSFHMEERAMIKHCELIMVDGDENHNRIFNMEQINSCQFRATWGRYGSSMSTRLYSMDVWNALRNKKLKAGYTDITNLQSVVAESKDLKYSPISDSEIESLVNKILRYASECIEQNYTIKKQDVTHSMVDSARKEIDKLSDMAIENANVESFNKSLENLFCIIPRQMKDVAEYLAESIDDYEKIIIRENDLLNVLSAMVCDDNTKQGDNIKKPTILEAFGISISPCDEQEIENIKKLLTRESAGKLKCAYRISNKKIDTRFEDYLKEYQIQKRDCHLYWHGTRNRNVWGILKKGMLLNPNTIINSKMFGYGLYFAPRAKKSIKYTSIKGAHWVREFSDEGYLFLMEVAYKKPLVVHKHENWLKRARKKDINNKGCDAVFASKDYGMLYNDEVIVYDEAQARPRYLIIIK